MRSVLMGTDFLKDIDGSIRMIETNTNIALSVNVYQYLDMSGFTSFVLNGGYTEIDFIFNEVNIQPFLDCDELEPPYFPPGGISPIHSDMNVYLKKFCDEQNIKYVPYKIGKTAITIPYIEDSVEKLIIRVAYDSTALIDDNYARDNWEFLKLMHDASPESIVRTYINDPDLGFDSLGSVLRNNGVHPNYCVKKRFTPSDNNIYPKMYRLTLTGELDSLKQNLEIDEYIQEYVLNPTDTLNNKYKHYRSVDLVYGPNLDVFNMWVVEQTNPVDVISVPDYAPDLQIQKWERGRYSNKYNNNYPKPGFKLSADDTTQIIKPDGTFVSVSEIQVGDIVKSINFTQLDPNMPESNIYKWSGITELMLNDYTISTAQLMNMDSIEYVGIIKGLLTSNGSEFSDVLHADIFRDGIEFGSGLTRIVGYEKLNIDDKILLFDTETSTVIEDSIVSVDFSFQVFRAYTLNFEQLDLFLTIEETDNRSRYGIVTHNWFYDCITLSCLGGEYVNADSICSPLYFANCTYNSVCVRYGGGYMFNDFCSIGTQYACSLTSDNVSFDGYCNGQK